MHQVHHDRAGGLAAPIDGRIYEGRVARIHADRDPLRYEWGSEYRDAAGIQEVLEQLQVVRPFCLLHPADLISKGARADQVGFVIGARLDGQHVVARILVTDPRAIQAIDAGMHELSLGYTSRLDDQRRQRDIRVDHLALVPRARCGPTCSLRVDGGDNPSCHCTNHGVHYTPASVSDQSNHDVAPAHDQGARNIVMEELQKKLGEALADAAAQKARADQLDGDLKSAKEVLVAAKTEVTNAKAELVSEKKATEAANARADQVKQDADASISKARLDADTAITTAAMARGNLLFEAAQILGAKDDKGQPVDRSKMSDAAIQLAVIKHVDNLDIRADEEPAYIRGVYAGAIARADRAAQSRADVRTTVEQVRQDNQRAIKKPTKSAARQLEQDARESMNA